MNLIKYKLVIIRRVAILFAFCVGGVVCAGEEVSGKGKSKPNIVLIISDDGGWADFGFNKCKDFKTPAIDNLAACGTVFDQGYVSGVVCSPSRAGLITGRYQTRFGHELNLGDKLGLPQNEKTIADRLKQLGYSTAAFGKWHLGKDSGYTPPERGFEYSYTFLAGGRSYLPDAKETDNAGTLRRNGKPVMMTEYVTDAIAEEAAKYITDAKKDKPFFMYVAFNCPHSPMEAKPGYEDRFSHLEDKQRRTLAAMQTSLDEGVAEILKALKDKGVYDNTLIWFVNDNGGATYWNYDNAGLRNRKGSLFEGGSRVAFFASWPGKIAEKTRYFKPVSALDIAATSLVAAGVKTLPEELDGVDLLPYLTKDRPCPQRPHENLFWRRKNVGAARVGDMKLILVENKPTLLFDLSQNPTEKNNLMEKRPDEVERLLLAYQEWDKGNVAPLWDEDEYWNKLAEVQHGSDADWDFKKIRVEKPGKQNGKKDKNSKGKQGDVFGE